MASTASPQQGLLGRPPRLVLAEPTRALDPVATAAVGQLLRATAAEGVAVLLSSHRLDELEAVSDRVVAIVNGAVRFDGTIAQLSGEANFADALRALLVDDSVPTDAVDER